MDDDAHDELVASLEVKTKRPYTEGYAVLFEASAAVMQAATLFRKLPPCGGEYHIVAEDWNLDDDNVAYCLAEDIKAGGDGTLGKLLAGLSVEERATALAISEGTLIPYDYIGNPENMKYIREFLAADAPPHNRQRNEG